MSPPPRSLDTDLCVLGGGSGGIGAALAAARTGARNLLVACRAASFSHLAAASCRLQRTMMTLGQAAGNAAALALAERVPLRSVPVAELQRRLREQGVEVPA